MSGRQDSNRLALKAVSHALVDYFQRECMVLSSLQES